MQSVTTDDQLLSLINKSPSELTDAELEQYIRNIRHTGIERQKRKAEATLGRKNAKTRRETKAIQTLRQKLTAKGVPPTKIEELITEAKKAMS